jgi:hypothetical protein
MLTGKVNKLYDLCVGAGGVLAYSQAMTCDRRVAIDFRRLSNPLTVSVNLTKDDPKPTVTCVADELSVKTL